MEDLQKQQGFIFAMIFDLANKLQVLGDRYLGQDGMTIKQWFLTLTIEQCGDTPPTLGEVAQRMGTSHQNAKQIALKLQDKGFLRFEKDSRDRRSLRLVLTPKHREFWDARAGQDEQFVADMFSELSEQEIRAMYEGIRKIHNHILERLGQEQP